jgi:hypothetical protein
MNPLVGKPPNHSLNVGTTAVLVGVLAYFFFLNQSVPMFADDYCRAKAEFSWWAAWRGAYSEYIRWSGRFPVMLINHSIFSGEGRGLLVFSAANSLAASGFCWYVVSQLKGSRPLSNICLLLTFIVITWFSTRSFGEAVLWKTGAVQYFWGTALASVLIFPLAKLVAGIELRTPTLFVQALFISLCLLGGMWLEHLSVAVVAVGLGILVTTRFWLRAETPRWLRLGYVAWVVGTLVLLVAPGNYARAEHFQPESLLNKILGITSYLFLHMDAVILLTMIFFLTISLIVRPHNIAQKIIVSAVLFITGIVAAYATVGAPVMIFNGRAAFPSQLFFVLSACALFPHQLFDGISARSVRAIRGLLVSSLVLASLYLIIDARTIYREYRSLNQQAVDRKALVEEAIASGEDIAVLPPLYFNPKLHTRGRLINRGRRFASDITIDPNNFRNTCYARYHGIARVVL